VKSQYSTQTDTVFHSAKVIADAFSDTKLIMNPVTTGARSLQVRSMRLVTEFIFVRNSGG